MPCRHPLPRAAGRKRPSARRTRCLANPPARLPLRFERLEPRCLLAVVSPASHAIDADPADDISITFGLAVNAATVDGGSLVAHAFQQGTMAGVRSVDGATVTLNPDAEFAAGERVSVTATNAIRGAGGELLPDLPYVWQFRAAVTAGTANYLYTEQSLSSSYDIDAIAVGDLDRDGYPDIVAVGEGYEIWRNAGDGTFVASATYVGGGSAYDVDVGDLNGDGYLDFFVAENGPNQVWLNNPSSPGDFNVSQSNLGTASSEAVRLGDVDGDGDLDAYVANWAVSDQVWLNNGAGVFSSSGQTLDATRGTDVELGDLDDDGDLDVIVISGRNDEPDIIRSNDGSGNFNLVNSLTASESEDVSLGDVDGDGDLDCYLALAHNLALPPGGDLLLINQGGFLFTPVTPSYTHSGDVDLGDMDGDGDLDALLGGLIYLNDGSGSFTFTGQNTRRGHLIDVDADGSLDVVAESDGPIVWLNEPRSFDFGDAPDSYRTLAVSDGAVHVANAITGLRLGWLVDSEADGQPGAQADGDDLLEQNDDDGIVFKTPLVAGLAADVAISSLQSGLLSGWIDWNGDGDWGDAGEQVFADEPVEPATVIRTISVPAEATAGTSYARFRISSQANLAWTGLALDGEVEDYAVTIWNSSPDDWGDAPAPYPTLAAQDGAVHGISNLYLGMAIDGEADGQPSSTATGDDSDSQHDEQGVFFNTSLTQGRLASVTLIASQAGMVDGWIDFDQSGGWDGSEQVFHSTAVSEGRNTFNIAIPETAAVGSTFARFRLSSGGGLGVIGGAADGEVEDYLVQIRAAVSNQFVLRQVTDSLDFQAVGDATSNADGTKVVFSSTADFVGENPRNANQVFMHDLTTGTLAQLTDAHVDQSGAYYVGSALEPSISADGSRVAYVSRLVNDAKPGYHEALTLYDGELGTSVLLQKEIYAQGPLISSDGDRVLYWRWLDPQAAPTEYNVFDTGGSPVPQTLFGATAMQGTPTFSGDGTTAAVVAYEDLTGENPGGLAQLFVYDVRSGVLTQLTDFASSTALGSVSLSADGGTVAFTSDHDFTGENPTNSREAFVMDVGSGAVTQLTPAGDGATYQVYLSADGSRYVYGVYENNVLDVYIAELAHREPDLLISLPGYENLYLNADGTRVLFTSHLDFTGENPDGSDELFMLAAVPDADSDGISDDEEDAGPNGGDGNGDSIPDSQQANVTSFVSRAGPYVTLESPLGTNLANVQAIDTPAPDSAPPEQYFPVGVFAFEVHGLTPADSTTVTLYLPPGTNVEQYYKFGPLPSNPGDPTWYLFNFDGTHGAEIAGDTVVLHYVDGQRGDSDLSADGAIVDPGGPAAPVPMDFGDAPDPHYPTLSSSDGARHGISDLYLGAAIDAEADGLQDPNAAGDDHDGTDDEDGVLFGEGLSVGLVTTLDIEVNDATGIGGYLDAWIDLDQDGIWSESEERVLIAEPVVHGTNQVPVSIPATAVAGETYARFRLSSIGELPVTGFVPDGEVEDYIVTIAPTWTNPVNHLDVNNDTEVVPQDALIIINYLNLHPGDSSPPPPPAAPPPYYDVTGDGAIVPQDALWIINELNRRLLGGDGEFDSAAAAGTPDTPAALVLAPTPATALRADDSPRQHRFARRLVDHGLTPPWRAGPMTGSEHLAAMHQHRHWLDTDGDPESGDCIDWCADELLDEELLDQLSADR